METRQTPSRTPAPLRKVTTATSPRPAGSAPLRGIERLMADAIEAAARTPQIDPGAVEYASWLQLLRRSTP